MRKMILTVLAALVAAACAASQRELVENRKVEVGQKQKESHEIFQAESVKLTGTYTQKGRPVDLSGTNTVIVWEINGWIDYTNTYVLCTGAVSSVSNTVVFNLPPAACNLQPGTYLGFVRALHSVSNGFVQDLVLSYQTISVEWSPGSSNYNRVAPLPAPQIGTYTNPAIWFLSSAPRREISQVWKVEEAPTGLIPTKFFMAEGVQLSGRATKGGSPLDLSATNTIYVWEIMGWLDYTNTYAIALGTASTNGQLRFELPPWQSNLSNGTYRGFVRSLTSDGTNLTTSEVLARQTISMEWSPDSRHYNLVGPRTYTDAIAISNLQVNLSAETIRAIAAEAALAVYTNRSAIAYSWGDHAGLYPTIALWTSTNSGFQFQLSALMLYTNRAATALQVEADTNAIYRLGLETNRAIAAETALAAYTNRAATALQVEADTNAIYRLSLETNRAIAAEAALAAYTNRAAIAYNWGDHSSAGYADQSDLVNVSNRTASLEGSVGYVLFASTNLFIIGAEDDSVNTEYNYFGNFNGFPSYRKLSSSTAYGSIRYDVADGWCVYGDINLFLNNAVSLNVPTNGWYYFDYSNWPDIYSNASALAVSFISAPATQKLERVMLESVYADPTGEPDAGMAHVNRALLAENSRHLEGHASSYFATTSAVSNLSNDILTLADIAKSYVVVDGVKYQFTEILYGKPQYTYITPESSGEWSFFEPATLNVWHNTSQSHFPPLTNWVLNGTPANLNIQFISGLDAQITNLTARVERVVSGTDAFEGILLDREINAWSDIGLTYSNAVRINSIVAITNNATWTGWTTTGDLLTNGSIFLTEGEYLQSPVQSNGISSYSFSALSAENGTSASVILLDGTNDVSHPYAGTNAVLKITAGGPLPGTTPGVSISNLIIIGYGDTVEAASGKIVSGLKIIDPPVAGNDVVNKAYSDYGDASVAGFAVAQIEAYAEDQTKTLHGAQLRLNQSWQAMTDNGQDFILSCGEISGSCQLVGTSNYFAVAQNDYPLLTFSSEATGLHINSYTLAYPDTTNRTVTLNIATNGVTGQPYAEWTKNLMVGEWTRVMTYSTNTYPTASGSNYVLRFTAPTGIKGFFRAMQPAGQSRIKVSANILDLGSNLVRHVASISFTNGWKIVCSTNGLQFVAP